MDLFNFSSNNPDEPSEPTMPTFKDFGLNENLFNEVKDKIKKYEKSKKQFEERYQSLWNKLNVIFIISSVFIGYYLNSRYIHLPVVAALFLFLLGASLIAITINGLINIPKKLALLKVRKMNILPSDSHIRIMHNYEEALYQYQQKLTKYEWELQEYKKYLKGKELDYWYSLSGWAFEAEFEKILNKHGFVTKRTSGSYDGGVDIYAQKNDISYAVQCKAHKNPIGPSIVRELFGVIMDKKNDKGILVNLGGFTQGVYNFVEGRQIILLDIKDVIELYEGINKKILG